ncbi:DNA polymerase III, epsilon subunit [Candidatus Endolissoclinum faulkneri L5]|uniref:DNA polymerase III subunit epsilon n=1 Tax=Candidatus Endolissoclinum faulkneri L5 TaxID=1401328 RepID=V9TRS4_9PROT|nr:DNA polymerase III subunit epsilon [Candidatus Endolissoclinum faulkneri]AHC73256.1 DNA polymerase III, epsilon subunit [Candidatus Endolissoclinum faulkneri L5]
MREIVLDTETTGLNPEIGDRIVEIGCLELINHIPSGHTLHYYFNPERDIPEETFRVHGLSSEFLIGYPVFAELADKILDFLGDSPLIIHNASFDMKFLNNELRLIGIPEIPISRALDTCAMARKKYPGAHVSLDALCRRFDIDNSNRDFHGALIDANLLASIYLELIGGCQPDLIENLSNKSNNLSTTSSISEIIEKTNFVYRSPRPHTPSSDEIAAHDAFLQKIKNPIWKNSYRD